MTFENANLSDSNPNHINGFLSMPSFQALEVSLYVKE
jgi:hypothetical protein